MERDAGITGAETDELAMTRCIWKRGSDYHVRIVENMQKAVPLPGGCRWLYSQPNLAHKLQIVTDMDLVTIQGNLNQFYL